MAEQEAGSGAKSYTKLRNTTYVYDGSNKLIASFDAVEELFISNDTYVIRYNRAEGPAARYEDRGSISETGAISGWTGFDGSSGGQVIGDQKGVYLTRQRR